MPGRPAGRWRVPRGRPRPDLILQGTAPAPVDRVLLYVDADLTGYAEAPRPTLVDGLDVARLGPGEHMSQAIVYLTDGRILTVNATFTV